MHYHIHPHIWVRDRGQAAQLVENSARHAREQGYEVARIGPSVYMVRRPNGTTREVRIVECSSPSCASDKA